jgi:pyridoxal phosphate enzyme (YggS family)
VLDSTAIRSRLSAVRDRIARAAERAQRDPSSVRLIAVSKTFPADHVRAAVDAGQIEFGENKVQEAFTKMDQTADLAVRWHLIGHLQSNKAKKAGARFDVIHSADDAALVRALDASAAAGNRRIELLVQVDMAGEATKHGAREAELALIFAAASGCTAAHITGLMLLPPAADDAEAARPHFRALVALRDRLLKGGVDPSMLSQLSMGMSHDFEVAVEEGATLVRVGTAIFGHRTYP